jgi:hypothetical protein
MRKTDCRIEHHIIITSYSAECPQLLLTALDKECFLYQNRAQALYAL